MLLWSVSAFSGTGNSKTDTLRVSGNCEMCKETIERALKKKDGIISRDWDQEKKILTVTYDESKINLQQIADKVAAVGYDNQLAKAPDAAYKNLPKCCHYKR